PRYALVFPTRRSSDLQISSPMYTSPGGVLAPINPKELKRAGNGGFRRGSGNLQGTAQPPFRDPPKEFGIATGIEVMVPKKGMLRSEEHTSELQSRENL